MDGKLAAISNACCEINRNLLLLQRAGCSSEMGEALNSAVEAINQFETEEMHALRVILEDNN